MTPRRTLEHIQRDARRFERWAVDGSFAGVAPIAPPERLELLALAPELLLESARTAAEWDARFRGAARALVVRRRALRRRPTPGEAERFALASRWADGEAPPSRSRLDARQHVRESAARLLSMRVLHEALAHDVAHALLVKIAPERAVRAHLPDLFEPLCLPRSARHEAALLFAAARWARARTPAARRRVLASMERRDLERRALERVVEEHGSVAKLRQARAQVLAADDARRARAMRAARAIRRAFAEAGDTTSRARATLAGIVRAVQLVATWDELLHVLVAEAARDISGARALPSGRA